MRRPALLAPVLAAALLTGCGSVDDRAGAATGVALDLLRAVAAGDGARACGLLAPGTVAKLEESASSPCPDAILDENLPEPSPAVGAHVYGQWAQVRLSGDTLFLAGFDNGWLVVAAGCTPRGEQPYDCKVEGD